MTDPAEPREAPVIDANIVLRFLLADRPEQSPRCQELLARLEAGQTAVYLPEIVLADIVWTLTSHYRWPREQTRHFLDQLLALRGVRAPHASHLRQALALFAERAIDFSDALIAAEMRAVGRPIIYSFDQDFDGIPDIVRLEP
jgi:predicted nucleic acid-binding protein